MKKTFGSAIKGIIVLYGIIGLFIIYNIYCDTINSQINTAAYYIVGKCDTLKGEEYLNSIEKKCIFSKLKKQVFILRCYLALDKGNDKEFKEFIDNNSKSKFLSDKGCSMTFEYTLLLYFYFKYEYEAFLSTCEKILNVDNKNVRFKLDEATKKILESCKLIIEKKYKEADVCINSIERKLLNKRNQAYLSFIQFTLSKGSNDTSGMKHYTSEIDKLDIKIPFIKKHIF